MSEPTQRIDTGETVALRSGAGAEVPTLRWIEALGGTEYRRATLLIEPESGEAAPEGPAGKAVRAPSGSREPTAKDSRPAAQTSSGGDTLEHESWGRYRLQRPLGRGGMGVVYLAEDLELGREVALKVFRLPEGRDEDKQRFGNEARITSQLAHPGIVPVYEIGITPQGDLYYAMKRVRGRELTKAMREDARSLVQKLRLMIQLCHALEYAHHLGVVHRDLKPDNVLVGEWGEVLVVDWGLAKILGRPEVFTDPAKSRPRLGDPSGSTSKLTLAGEVVGTISYMAPEQARGDQHLIGPETDVYALGAILFELVAGKPPIGFEDGVSVRDMLVDVAEKQRPDARDASSTPVPADLSAIVNKALAVRIADRYRKVSDLRRDIEAHIENRAVSAHAASVFFLLGKFLSRHRAIVRTAAVAATLLAVVAVVFVVELVREAEETRVARSNLQAKVQELESVVAQRDMAERAKDEAQAQRSQREEAEHLLTSAKLLLDSDPRSDLGLAKIREAIVGAPDYFRTHYALAQALAGREELASALEALGHCITLKPEFMPAWWLQGEILRDLLARERAANPRAPAGTFAARTATVRATYEQIANASQDEAERASARGFIALLDGYGDQAERFFEAALAKRGDLAQALEGRVLVPGVQVKIDDMKGVIVRLMQQSANGNQPRSVRRLLEHMPEELRANFAPMVSMMAGDDASENHAYPVALDHYQRAAEGYRRLDLTGQWAIAHARYARTLLNLRRIDEALAAYAEVTDELATTGDASTKTYMFERINAMRTHGCADRAIPLLGPLVRELYKEEDYSGAAQCVEMLVLDLLALGDIGRAREWLDVLDSSFKRTRRDRAYIDVRLARHEDRPEAGIEIVERALQSRRIDPRYALVLKSERVRCLLALGKHDDALAEVAVLAENYERMGIPAGGRADLAQLGMRCLRAAGKLEEAYARGVASDVKDRSAVIEFELGCLAYLLEHDDAADSHFQAVEALGYNPVYPRLFRAMIAQRRGTFDAFRALVAPKDEDDPSWPAPLLACLLRKGDVSELAKAPLDFPSHQLEVAYFLGEQRLAESNKLQATNQFRQCAEATGMQDRFSFLCGRDRLVQLGGR